MEEHYEEIMIRNYKRKVLSRSIKKLEILLRKSYFEFYNDEYKVIPKGVEWLNFGSFRSKTSVY